MGPLPVEYWRTSYVAWTPRGEVRVRIGESEPTLEGLLRSAGETVWAYLTAWNPGGRVLTREENDGRQGLLRERLAGRVWYGGEGVGDDGRHAEGSVLVVGMGEAEAVEVGRAFGQNAVVVGEVGGVARLVDCRPGAGGAVCCGV